MVVARGGNNPRVNQLRHTIFIPRHAKPCNKPRPRGDGLHPNEMARSGRARTTLSASMMGMGGWWFHSLSPAELAARERAPLTAALERATRAAGEVGRLRAELARMEEDRERQTHSCIDTGLRGGAGNSVDMT
jgi:hypothetical protein